MSEEGGKDEVEESLRAQASCSCSCATVAWRASSCTRRASSCSCKRWHSGQGGAAALAMPSFYASLAPLALPCERAPSENTLWVRMHLEFNPGWVTTDPPADLAIKFSYGMDCDWAWFFKCQGTSVTVNGKRDFNHMGMETATCWVLDAFNDPSVEVEGQAADRLAAPYNPER